MPDRRQFLRWAVGAPVSVLANGVPNWSTLHSPGTTSMMVVARQPNGFVTIDPRTGETSPLDLPADTRRVRADTANLSLLIDLASGSLLIGGQDRSRPRVEVHPIPPSSRPLVVAARVIGHELDDAGRRVVIHDLKTGEADMISGAVLPGASDRWLVQEHPTRPAAVIDARDVGGGVVLLPADAPGAPRVCPVPPESSVGIAPGGNDIVRIDHLGDASALVCGSRDAAMNETLMPYLMLGAGPAGIRGPIGSSANLLVTIDRDRLAVVSCAGSSPGLVDEAIIDGDDDASLGFWRASSDGAVVIGELASDSLSSWRRWRIGDAPHMLPDLPLNLETGMASGGAGRWFHGAELTETSLGAGALRLMTIDIESGEVVFDHVVDRRLELAATGVSADGSLLAHCQSGNTAIEMLIAAFGDEVGSASFRIDIEDAPVAAAEVALDVVSVGKSGVVAAGLRWGNPDHHAPVVLTLAVTDGDIAGPVRVDGELIGIITPRHLFE